MSRIGVLRGLNAMAAIAVIAWVGGTYLLPAAATRLYGEQYKRAMFQCDNVMREHFIAKQLVTVEPSEQGVANLEASEIGLLSCHDYDRLRKRLLRWGVSEPTLSLLGLDAIEESAKDVRQFVETHEIRY